MHTLAMLQYLVSRYSPRSMGACRKEIYRNVQVAGPRAYSPEFDPRCNGHAVLKSFILMTVFSLRLRRNLPSGLNSAHIALDDFACLSPSDYRLSASDSSSTEAATLTPATGVGVGGPRLLSFSGSSISLLQPCHTDALTRGGLIAFYGGQV